MKSCSISPCLIPGTPVGISIYSVTQERCHYHEGFLEIIYCFKGSSTIHISYEDIILEPGDIISCDPYDIHAISSEEENLFISFYFDLTDPVFKNPELPFMFFVCERYVLKKEKQDELPSLKHLLLTLLYFYCFPHPKVPQKETIHTLAIKIIDIMLRHFHFFDYVANELDYSDETKNKIERLLLYMNTHYHEKLTISRLCEQVYLTPAYLSHFFNSITFFTLSDLHNFIRVYHSERLLLDTNQRISDISYEVGFSDPKFYYRVFKVFYRHTPLQHRKYFRQIAERSEENLFYRTDEISAELEHYISYYFATLHIPNFWNVPYMPYRNLPVKKSDSEEGA